MTSEASFQLQSLGSAVVKEANYGTFLQLEGGKVTVEALYCPGGIPYYGLYGEPTPKKGTFFRLKIYKRVGKTIIPVCKNDLKWLRDAFYGCEKVKTSWFNNLSIK